MRSTFGCAKRKAAKSGFNRIRWEKSSKKHNEKGYGRKGSP